MTSWVWGLKGSKAGNRAPAACKGSGFQAELLEHGDEEIAERFVLHGVEGEVLTVFESAAR
jgi:hypothetical protein